VNLEASKARERNTYFDLLRGFALGRVIAYHTLEASWLHVAFPAMGVMFALAGSLMARSLDRRRSTAVIGSRALRLLPPFWMYGAIALLVGWETLGPPGEWYRLVFWIVPLKDPHDGVAGSALLDTLWYVRAYLWFVLLSPLLLWLFRRLRLGLVLVPLLLLPVVEVAGQGSWAGRGLLNNLMTYGACWILGFAEFEGLLARIPAWLCGLAGVLTGAGGLALQIAFPTMESMPNDLGYALWSAAAVLLLLRWRPDTSWVHRVRWFDRLVTVVNARAVSIYLWHDPAIVAVVAVFGAVGLHTWGLVELPVVFLVTGVIVIAVGWVEDLGARRRPTLLPKPPYRARHSAPAPAADREPAAALTVPGQQAAPARAATPQQADAG
jgi:peptidoglycan/LPS O-acetylase OafA/YrhL